MLAIGKSSDSQKETEKERKEEAPLPTYRYISHGQKRTK
jgi:hypothetical protein